MMDKNKLLYDAIRDVKDFPKQGIVFKDLTTLFKKSDCLNLLVEILFNEYKDKGITKVVGIESRGFIIGPILAYKLNAGFVPVRKPGKLPSKTFNESYKLEYGTDTIQIHVDALNENDVVLLHDDLLATGGTMAAAERLVSKFGIKNGYISFIVELGFLHGREKLNANFPCFSVLYF